MGRGLPGSGVGELDFACNISDLFPLESSRVDIVCHLILDLIQS